MSLADKITGLKRLVRLFPLSEIQRFRAFRTLKPNAPIDHFFRLRPLNNLSICCRAGTSDPRVLIDAFDMEYHVPPQLPSDPATIIDLGCNVGYTVAHYAVLYPNAKVIGIELDATNAEVAQRNTRSFGDRVQIVHCGVWIKDDVITYGGEEEWAFRIGELNGQVPDPRAKTAPAYTMNTLFQKYAPRGADFIKMDIEGAEAFVLREQNDWLRHVGTLYLEYHGPATYDDCKQWLEALGFACRRHPTHPSGLIAVNQRRELRAN